MVGDRFFGWRGAFAALAGMITIPLIIVIMLCALYTQFATLPAVSGALKGMGGVAGGMIIGGKPLSWPLVCAATLWAGQPVLR